MTTLPRLFSARWAALTLALATVAPFNTACKTSSETRPSPRHQVEDGEGEGEGEQHAERVASPDARPTAVVLPEAQPKITGAPNAIGNEVEPAPDIVAMLARKAKIVSARANRLVGNISAPMKRGKPESTLGNFVTDAMRTETESVAGIPVDL